ncbi:ATP-binding protein [Chitinivorax sp. PXF-14]|uniref:ATP-binding protein n=1 Tax=Chitinivorax sp. PXF-14 TaxID=3230488 RepID=UPI0034653A73
MTRMMASLRIRLLVLLGVLILASASAQFITAFQSSLSAADKLFDYHMQQMALALQDSAFDTLQLNAEEGGNNFDFVIQIWSDDGVKVYQSRPHRTLPEQSVIGYSNVMLFNGEWRVYAVHTHHRVIQVAQQLQARRDRAIGIALRSLWPIWLGSALLLMAAWWVVTAALKPLARVQAELSERSPDSLEPVSTAALPREIKPLVAEINQLLARVGDSLARQQRFLADAAHELRSPLTALKLQVQLLARAKDDAARTQAQERLVSGTERAVRLTEQLLQLARQDAATALPQAAGTALIEGAALALADTATLAASKQVAVSSELDPAARVTGNADALAVLVRNLLDNAIRYTPAGGSVALRVALGAGHAVLTLDDSGPGIARDEHARIFDRFYRPAGTVEPGSGLGLAIVKAIADRHGAALTLGQSPLGGLRVAVSFPPAPNSPR